MSEEKEFYQTISQAILGSDGPELADLIGEEFSHRIEAHRGNYKVSSQSALISAYPVVERLVGDEYMRGLAQRFVREFPPKAATLTLYGDDFPEFLRNFAPVQQDMPWLAAVAELDRAWFFAYAAKDDRALTAQDLQSKTAIALPMMAPGLIASVRILRFVIPAYSIWQTNKQDKNVRAIDLKKGAEWAIIWRDNNQVRHQKISQAEYVFLSNIEGGLSFAHAYAEVVGFQRDFNLQQQFSNWLAAGIFKGEKL